LCQFPRLSRKAALGKKMYGFVNDLSLAIVGRQPPAYLGGFLAF
jgi:hypothetical protein